MVLTEKIHTDAFLRIREKISHGHLIKPNFGKRNRTEFFAERTLKNGCSQDPKRDANTPFERGLNTCCVSDGTASCEQAGAEGLQT
jgi:hypothetical protein